MVAIQIILSLLIGISIGIYVEDKSNSAINSYNESIIGNLEEVTSIQEEDLIFYRDYVKYLEDDYIAGCKDAFNDTLKENINLKKKLKAYE